MADDLFERFLTEKLWDWIPGVYRHEDGLGPSPGTLRALVEAMAGQFAVIRRSHDRLWEDRFIAQCEDWAIPYIADLVGTRLVSVLDARGQRADVAKTIHYRRRRGTLAIIEQLSADIAGWRGVAREGFRGLARAPHRLDIPPRNRGAAHPGAAADLRLPLVAERAGGPFDVFHHTPDLRAPRGRAGRFAINRLAIHLHRLAAMRVAGVAPAAAADAPAGAHAFTFDPSGRDVPLFAPDAVGEDGAWHAARPWEVPASIPCRLLNDAAFRFGEDSILALRADGLIDDACAEALRPLRGRVFPGEARLRDALARRPNGAALSTLPVLRALAARALLPDCGKAHLWTEALGVSIAGSAPDLATSAGADLSAWTPSADHALLVDPRRGRLLLRDAPAEPPRVMAHCGVAAPIGATGAARREPPGPPDAIAQGGAMPGWPVDGTLRIADSATYAGLADVAGIGALAVFAGSQQRPYLALAQDLVLDSTGRPNARLALEGLWFGADAPRAIVLRGDWEVVRIAWSTLDPGGARTADPGTDTLPAVTLRIEGRVERLEVARSILGPVLLGAGGALDEAVITDSILQAQDETAIVCDLPRGVVTLGRATLLGGMAAGRLFADQAILTGPVDIADLQTGCFRFSAAAEDARLPHPYRAQRLAPGDNPFRSRRLGDPHFARLRDSAPAGLREGAEDGSELGAFGAQREAARRRGLLLKLDEYMPFGLLPVLVHES